MLLRVLRTKQVGGRRANEETSVAELRESTREPEDAEMRRF
jgi:hypothetical protein